MRKAVLSVLIGFFLGAVTILTAAYSGSLPARQAGEGQVGNNELVRSAEAKSAELPDGAVLVAGSGEVDVEGGIIPLFPLTIGQIEDVRVKVGAHCRRGDVLACLDARLAEHQIKQAESNLAQAQARLAQANESTREANLRDQQQEQAIKIAEAHLEMQRAQVKRVEDLVQSKQAPAVDLLSAQTQFRVLQLTLAIEQLKKDQLLVTKPEHALQLADAAVKGAEAALAIAQLQRTQCSLTAPTDGTVLRILAAPGMWMTQGARDPVLWFCPDRSRIVRCEIDQQFSDRVFPGMQCDIYNDRVDHPQWKGTVQTCSDWIAPRRSLLDNAPLQRDSRTMECIIQLQDDHSSLRIGQRVRVIFRRDP
jgi:multidrug resistance efflux pump